MIKTLSKWVLPVLLVLSTVGNASAQIAVPHVFSTSIPVSQLNTDLSTLGTGALNRTGGTVTGNITVNSGVTIDGVDISAVLAGTGTPTFSTVTVSSTGASALDVAGGINAGSGNVGIVDSTGKIPALSSTYFASLSGANLTGLAFSQLPTTWTAAAYSAGDFTASGSLTWTVDSIDVGSNVYVLMGKTLMWSVQLNSTSTGGTASSELRVAIPGSNTFNRTCAGSFHYVDNGTVGTGMWQALASNTYVTLRKDAAAPNWSNAAANTTSVYVNLVCEVQ